MAITVLQPNTIWLGGPRQQVNDLAAGVTICPGMLVERYNPSGTIVRLRPHATADVSTGRFVATEASMLNKSVNDGYAVADLVECAELTGGSSAWMLIASGQNITAGQKLQSAGDGSLKAYATLGAAIFSALESVNNTNGTAGPTNPPPETGKTSALTVGWARIRVEVV
jgi:hypothetical protein